MRQRLTDAALELPEGSMPASLSELLELAPVVGSDIRNAIKVWNDKVPEADRGILEAEPEN